MKKIIAFIQNNFISCVCLFLAATIFTGSITLAKYISTETSNVGSSAGSFHCSGSVDDVSSLSFANLDFWGGSEKDTPMNAIHSLNFLVNNYEERTDGESVTKHVSVAKMGYTLMFSAPAIFLEKLAMQLFESPDTVMTPQIVLADLLATANDGKYNTHYNTANGTKYNGTAYTDFEFKVNVSNSGIANAYTATAELPDGKGNMVLKIEPFMQNMTQTLKFRLWDVSKLTSESNKTVDHEGGDLIAPLYADVQADVLCYRISISMPQFTLAAGVEEQDRYSLRFVTTSAINDHELGGFLTDNDKGDTLKSVFKNKTAYFKTMTETVTDKDSSGNVTERNTYYVIGNPRAYTTEPTESKKTTTARVKEYTETVTTTVNNASRSYIYYDNNNNIVTEASATYRLRVNKGASYKQEDVFSYSDSSQTFIVTTTDTETVETKIATGDNTETITQDVKVKTVKTISANDTTTATTKTTITPSSGTITIQVKDGDSWNTTNALDKPITLKNSSAPTEITLPDETYSREIVRVTSYAESITFKKVYRRVEDALGNVTQTEYDSEDNAFELFDGVIQKYFLSQCYSKSYPFKVNVYFEQLQS